MIYLLSIIYLTYKTSHFKRRRNKCKWGFTILGSIADFQNFYLVQPENLQSRLNSWYNHFQLTYIDVLLLQNIDLEGNNQVPLKIKDIQMNKHQVIMKANESFKLRQKYKKEFNDLFQVLFKIPDKDLHNRVVNAINNNSYCVYCRKKAIISRESSTQTDSMLCSKPENKVSFTDRIIHFKSYKTQGVRKRKKTKKGPEVVQSPKSQLLYPQEAMKRKIQDPMVMIPTIKARRISSSSMSSLDSNLLLSAMDEVLMTGEVSEEQIKIQMVAEYRQCLVYRDGLLPIQEAIKYRDCNKFQRQLFVLAFKKININDLYTDDDCQLNLMELAVKSKCSLFFFEKLLENGMLVKDLDEDGNSVVNLICKWMDYSFDNVLKLILTRVTVDVLKIGNQEGMTVFHHCVLKDNYKMLKTLLDFVDEKLGIPLIPNYLNHKLETDEDFFAFYKLAYNAINHRISSPSRESIHQKMKLLNIREMKSGRTPLFLAAHSQNQHMCLMLLNHYASPDIKDHSGTDVITYRHTEGIVDEKTKYMDDVFLNVSLVLAKHKFIFK